MIRRYGIQTLCGSCGQRGGGWSLVQSDYGPVVYADECEQALAGLNVRIAKLKAERDQLVTALAAAKAQQKLVDASPE